MYLMMVFLIVLAVPAAAQERPAVRPQHDVAVTYRADGTDANGRPETHQIRMSWTDQGRRMRLEMAGQPGFALVDFAASRMTMVLLQQHSFIELPFDPQHAPGLDIPASVSMTRAGTDTVAGTPCTLWDMKGPQGAGTACITEDGLTLRLREAGVSGSPAALEAVSVAYGPQPADLFTVPPGLHPIMPR